MTGETVHPHVLATGGKPDSSTHFLCPKGPTDAAHHLVPRLHGGQRKQTCRYCGKTDADLRREHGL